MDIAAVLPTKTPNRPEAFRAGAPKDDPYQDDFAAELSGAEGPKDADRTVAKTSAAESTAPDDSNAEAPSTQQDIEQAPDPAAQLAVTPSQPQAQPAPASTPTMAPVMAQVIATTPAVQKAAPNGSAPAVEPPLKAAVVDAVTSQTTNPQSIAAAALTSTTPAAQANTPSGTNAAPTKESLAAVAATQPLAASMVQAETAAPQTLPPAQPIVPPSDGLSALTLAPPTTKKTGEVKQTAPAQAQTATPAQTSVPQTAQSAAPVAPAANAGGNTKDGTEQRSAEAGQTVAAGQAQSPVATIQEFKPDASAAALAPQPASQTVQNAAPAAPALVAQNAPVFVPPEALGVAIARKALEGINKFELRLDPPEMGRLDVSLEIDEAGNTRAHIRAERPEALELLQREAKGMEQALRQAGLSLDHNSLSFSLASRDGREAHEHAHHGRRAKFNAVLPEDEIHATAIRGSAASTNGVDLRV